jgi:hypothetical protein
MSTSSAIKYSDVGFLKQADLYNDAIQRRLIDGKWDDVLFYKF